MAARELGGELEDARRDLRADVRGVRRTPLGIRALVVGGALVRHEGRRCVVEGTVERRTARGRSERAVVVFGGKPGRVGEGPPDAVEVQALEHAEQGTELRLLVGSQGMKVS